MSDFIEHNILSAIENLLTGRANELLGEAEFQIAPFEFGAPVGVGAVEPVLRLTECERSEKERIVRLDSYALMLTLQVPEGPYGGRDAYAYGAVISRAVAENCTLGDMVDRAVMTGKKYVPPKTPHCGEGWQVELKLHILPERRSGY
ncbi:hypothetical protein AGMMS49546_33770 [Spirochaetia bacterium]|nr:hypothetical protein AGMMS49546_33770 [Spirochaetia bacterium]